MAYVSQELKATLAPEIKKVLAKYKMKGTISVRNNSTLVVTLSSGPLKLLPDGRKSDVINHYHYTNTYKNQPVEANFVGELISAMKGKDFFDHTDSQTDYFHCSHYMSIRAGKWDKPYVCLE